MPEDKPRAKQALAMGIEVLAELQDMLYAQDNWAVLLVFQAMDAAGKDGAIKHVCRVSTHRGARFFHSRRLPATTSTMITCGVALNVSPSAAALVFSTAATTKRLWSCGSSRMLHRQKIPPEVITKDIWEKRFQDIRGFERYFTRNVVAICKFFLHVSSQEQKKRFLERIEEPEKNWKFSPADAKERHYWKAYLEAYEDMIRNTATKAAP
ncbi:MAG TPA: hypothetical protein VMT22_03760 [Terriglobales bacterium]|nr:hypothetical protein [Terriglobales bacterium]